MPGAVVLHSGGQDSTTCLAWAIRKYGKDNVYPVAFDYGQKHWTELECAQDICELFEVRLPYILDVHALETLGGAALTNKSIRVSADASGTGNEYAESHGLPSTFVPGRNMLFLTLAAAYGAKVGAYNLVTGVCEADRSGYPDCRREFVEAASIALSRALDEEIVINAPLLSLDKARTFALARDLHVGSHRVLDVVLQKTHTCYNGAAHTSENWHEWGYGCAECPACDERRRGFEEFKQMGDNVRV